MAKSITHAKSSARKFGGKWEDYIEIHDFMDSSKGAVPDNSHRILTHQSWFIAPNGPLEKCFGKFLTNSDGKEIPIRSIGEQHIMEDFNGMIPTVQDYLMSIVYEDWFHGKGKPPSCRRLDSKKRFVKKVTLPNPKIPYEKVSEVRSFKEDGQDYTVYTVEDDNVIIDYKMPLFSD